MHRATILLACVVFSPVVSAAELPDARQAAIATDRCRAGDEALHRRDAAAAAAAYGEALAAFPDHPGARVGLGHVAMLRREFETALAEYEGAERAWMDVQAAVALARADRNQEASRTAAAILEYINRVDENVEEGMSIPGMTHTSDLLKGAMLDNQVRQLQKAAEPQHAVAAGPPPAMSFFRGTALYRLGRFDEAVTLWLDVERRDPAFGPVYNNLVEGLLLLGRKDEARATARAAEERGIPVHPNLLARLD
jgi:tetratricopeptide (TPR) repeat protein